MSDFQAAISINIDGSGAEAGAKKVTDALDRITGKSRSSSAANDNVSDSLDRIGKSARSTAKDVDALGSASNKLKGIIAGVVSAATIKQVVDLADGYTRFTNSLRVAGVEGANQKVVIDKLFTSAQKYGVQLEAMGALYGKASQAQKTLNASQADLLKFSDGVAAALKIQGGNVNEAAGALHQLGQVLTGAKVQAEEYNSIIDGAYPILQAVAAGSDKYKGSVAALTAAVKSGKVTSKEFFDSFLKGSAFLEERASKANFTVAASWQVLTNALQKYVGEADQANAVTGTIGASIRGFGANLDTVVPIIATLGLALGVGFVTRTIAASAAATGATTAFGAMGVAARGAAAAISSAFGGPIGMTITAVAGLLISVANESRNTQAAFEANATAAEKFEVQLSALSKAAVTANGETRGVGTGAAAAEPSIWSFSNASGHLTQQLWEQAKAARAARVELLQSQKAEAQKRIMTGADATWDGSRRLSRASNDALKRGDVLESASLGWKSIVSDVRNGLSGGRTGREGLALATDSGKVAAAIQKQIDELLSTPIGRKDVPTGGGSPPTAPANKKGDGASEAERKAKAQKEFWQGLEREAELSKLTTDQAERRRKELEIEDITGKSIAEIDAQRVLLGKKRLSDLLAERKTNQFIADSAEQHRLTSISLNEQESLFAKQLAGITDDQFAVEKQVSDFRIKALQEGRDIQSEAYGLAEAQVRADAERGVQIAKNNKLLADGKDLFAQYTKAGHLGAISTKYADQREAAATAYAGGKGKYSADDYRKVLSRIAKEEAQEKQDLDDKQRQASYDKWSKVISNLGDVFGGVFGKIADQLQGLIGSLRGESGIGGLMKSIGLGDAFDGSIKKMFGKDSIFGKNGSMGKMFSGLFGKNGTLIKGLGDKLGAIGAGAQVGQTVAGLGKMISSKFSTMGSTIGGAIGQFAGPIGAVAGSIIGGVLGGMLKKAKWGTASVNNGIVTTGGNKQAYKDNASTAGNSITSGLDSIAEQLGGAANGNYSVSVGQYKGKWRVSTSGRTGKLKGKYGDVTDFGKDGAEEAIQFALADAIRDGAITGIRASTQALLTAGDDLQAQLEKALKFEGVFKELKTRLNPVAAAVDTLNTEMKSLTKIFQEAGASSEEYAQLEQLRALKLQDIIKEQTSSFQAILDSLNGEAGGFSSLSVLSQNLGKFEAFKTDIAAGKTVNQDDFSALMDSIINGVNDIYGANSATGQNILGDVRNWTTQAMANVSKEFTNAVASGTDTVSAIQSQTNAYVAQQQEANSWLAKIYAALSSPSARSGNVFASGAASNVNGRVVSVY